MKILYLTKGDHVDYQNDCLLIGLKELFGADVVDYNKQEHNYTSYNENLTSKLYGKGMTVTRILKDLEVDRTDITNKIKNKYFDYIVYGSIWRCSDYINNILEYYPKNKIIAVDGEDETRIHATFNLGILYFKRELIFDRERLLPISFAIPTSKLTKNFSNKIRNFSFITPFDPKTYVYTNEKDYYEDYLKSRFGVTVKKAGWDCMRHYEILANSCIPYFVNIDQCPERTLVNFPKQLCKEVCQKMLTKSPEEIYDEYAPKFFEFAVKNNTTLSLGKYFVSKIESFK